MSDFRTYDGTQMTREQVMASAQMFKAFAEYNDSNVHSKLFGLACGMAWDFARALDRIRQLKDQLEAEKRKATDAIVTPIADAAAASCVKSGAFLGNIGSFELRHADD